MRIEPKEAEEKINGFAEILKSHQFEILQKSLPEEEQNIIFNALRNLRIIINEMRDQLKTAFERKENPITAERCLALMPFIQNLSKSIDEFEIHKNGRLISYISMNTRNLRKKAKQYNLLTSLENEMKEVNLPIEEIKNFCDELNKKIELEMQDL
ncbi:MAG: hypothetical protein NTW30_05140 [Candidatus Aenigmarchaeota archaeon]|nr:hypothetical protein [Candidatus Aenigmarchaeota archaeon]